jgi:hypothetical protein
MTVTRALRAVLPFSLALTAACLDVEDQARDRVGLLTARAFLDGATPVIRGSGTFYRVGGLNVGIAEPTACLLYPYSPNPTAPVIQTLDAGDNLAFTVQGTTEPAVKEEVGSFIRYDMEVGEALGFSVGDTLTVNIPGATGGFVTTSARVRLAEPFTVGSVPDFVEGQPLDLTWTAAPTTGSVMLLRLRYNSTGESVTPDAEVVCLYTDDGTGSVPAALAGPWANAEELSRSVLFTRLREVQVNFDARTRVLLRSFYDVPTQALPLPSPILRGDGAGE